MIVQTNVKTDSRWGREKRKGENGVCGESGVPWEVALGAADGFGMRAVPENDLVVLVGQTFQIKKKDMGGWRPTVMAGAFPVLYHEM